MKILYVLLVCIIQSTFALGVADFVPSFIMPSQEDPNLPVKPLVEVKRNASSGDTWYCNQMQNKGTNVFCEKKVDKAIAKVMTYKGSIVADNSKMVENSATGDYAKSTVNQNSLQDQQTRDAISKSNNNFLVPIKPSNDVNFNVNPVNPNQQVEINIKY